MDRLADYDFDLPEDLIAQYPADRRDASRLLVVGRATGTVSHGAFTDIPDLIGPQDCLVLNDTRVRRARLLGRRPGGGRAEALLLRPLGEGVWEALCRPTARLRPGIAMDFDPTGARRLIAEVVSRQGEGICHLRLVHGLPLDGLLDELGHVPLPPYIRREDDPAIDPERYQTVYARHSGAVAAPTAGLHFTEEMLARIRARGTAFCALTLHVGLGTFRPVTAERLADHHMHAEEFTLDEPTAKAVNATRAAGGRCVAVGTTCVRTLESCVDETGRVVPRRGVTDLFIRPGYRFRVVDVLLTNFHLPRSTLLMLVSAFAGHELTREAYRIAVAERYRFFSYGDAMLIV